MSKKPQVRHDPEHANVLRIEKNPEESDETPRGEINPAPGFFRPLGHDRGTCFFLTDRGRQVLAFQQAELASKPRLFLLAPLAYWEREFPSKSGFSGAAVDQAVDYLTRACLQAGVFRPDAVRGRGVWWEEPGTVIVHAGGVLLVNGVETALMAGPGSAIYEARVALDMRVALADPLSASEGATLYRWALSLPWEEARERADGGRVALDGTLLAGWIVCALAAGALEWRPHAFVTGPSGTGKSQVVMKTVRALLGGFGLRLKSAEASAAGVRQRLGPDALAVTWDEAEADTQGAARRIQDMLALMRIASSADDAEVVKGGGNGIAVGYQMRSAFLCAAVRVPMVQRADQSRITVLNLRHTTEQDQQRFREETLEAMVDLLEPSWAARLRARVLSRVSDLRANARVFGVAVSQRLGDARLGDQYGALLAGAYLLLRDGVVDATAARRWIDQQEWLGAEALAEESDEGNLLAALLESRVQVGAERERHDFSLGELVAVAAGGFHRAVTAAVAAAELGRYGLRIEQSMLLVSNTHRGVARLLEGTVYAVGWAGVLRRLAGATAAPPLYYGGVKSRGTAIPLERVLEKGLQTGPPDPPSGLPDPPY